MSFSAYRFLADENVDRDVVDFISSMGYDVFHVKGSPLQSKPDIDILNYAMSDDRVVITHDTDFTTIVYKDKVAFSGIIFFAAWTYKSAFYDTYY